LSRFGSDPHAFFNAVYQGAAPWEIGGIQPAMAMLIERFPPLDPALDLGCASGDLAIHLARLGHEVAGVDFVESAIEQAEAKRASLPDDVARRLTFSVADATRPAALGRFGSVFDSGFLHLLDDDETARLVEALSVALVPGGRLYLHEFAVEFPIENVPRAITEDELRARFTQTAGWRILYVAPAEFLNTVAAPTAAIAACIERL
jgi:SAM-dependent methyltransferase